MAMAMDVGPVWHASISHRSLFTVNSSLLAAARKLEAQAAVAVLGGWLEICTATQGCQRPRNLAPHGAAIH